MAGDRAIDRLRTLQHQYDFIEEILHELDEPDPRFVVGPDAVFSQEQSVRIRAAVSTLPLEQRQAIELAFLGGLTQNEIAGTLNQPVGTVKARIRRGMFKLRDLLKDIV
jgi:RNA polymerase sigma-70 factor (ECF subfamily)